MAAAVGFAALSSGTEAQAARPCPGSTLPCLDDYDPVRCIKPGEGWRIYSNDCYAIRECARRCEPAGF
jgi:hypothetical protein